MAGVKLHRGDVLVFAISAEPHVRRRVLYICAESARVALFDVDDPNALPEWAPLGATLEALREGHVAVAEVDPHPPDRRRDEELSAQRRADRDRWWSVIQPEVYLPSGDLDPALFGADELRERVWRMCAVAGTTRNVIRKWLRRWWRHGQEMNALLSGYDRSGGPGKKKRIITGRKRGRPKIYAAVDNPGLNIGEWAHDRIVRGGLRFHQRAGFSLPKAWQATKETLFRRAGSEGVEMRDGVPVPVLLPARETPSYDQFLYWYNKERDRRAEYVARHGERAAVLRRDPKGGSFLNAVLGPGHSYIIDATIGDIYLLSTVEPGRVIGRPVIYFVIDAYSQMIVGLYVGLEGPSWTGAKAALENAFADKSDYLRAHGFDPTVHVWPCSGICLKITADRGELLAKASDHAVRAFQLTLTNCPAYRPDLKSLVEGSFKIANDRTIHWQPGAVYKVRDRGDPDYRYDAMFTLESFTKLMIIHSLEHNNAVALRDWVPDGFPIPASGDPTPLDLWEWGMENHTGQLRRYDRDPRADREWIRINLLRETEGTLSRDGIKVNGLRYWSKELAALGWFDRDRPRGRPDRMQVAFDDRDVGRGWVRLDQGRRVVELVLHGRDQRYAGHGYYDVLDECALRNAASAGGRHRESQDQAYYNALKDNVGRSAAAQREDALDGNRPVLTGMREARARQREAEAAREIGPAGHAESPVSPESARAQPAKVIPIRLPYMPPPSDLDLL